MKVIVIGGGSSYTPELVKGFLDRIDTFPLAELWLVDIDPQRLEIVGGFAQRMVAARGAPFVVHLTTDRRAGMAGASYVITQLRVGGMAARQRDEYLGQRHGLIGQETTGVGGMAKALRTIPVLLEIAADLRELAPGALLVNFTNPAGLVTEALARYAPDVPAVGVCNVPITAKMHILKLLAEFASQDARLPGAEFASSDANSDATSAGLPIAPERAELNTLGLNHLSWHRGFTIDGEDVWPLVIEGTLAELQKSDHPDWDPALIATLQLLPNYYLSYYYYTGKKLAEQANWPPSRAEQVMQVEADLLAQYADPLQIAPPADLMKRGGAWYSTLATQLLSAHYNDLNETHIVNVPQRGAVAGWPGDWVLEMPCRISRRGVEPLAADPLPPACFGLLASVKAYELLTVEAAVHGDHQAAYVAGTSNNCWGWNAQHQIGRVTGNGGMFGEYGGSGELVEKAVAAVASHWTMRGPQTALSDAFVSYCGARSLADLLEGLIQGWYRIGPAAAPLVFQTAEADDPVAGETIRWAARELASLAAGVIRQIGLEQQAFDVVLVGSMYNGGPLLLDPLAEAVWAVAPGARLVRLHAPPVVGAVLLGMQAGGIDPRPRRSTLTASALELLSDARDDEPAD